MLYFYGSIVKHGTQNIRNDNHQWLSDSFRVHQIRFRSVLRPDPTGAAYSDPPDPLTNWFKWLYYRMDSNWIWTSPKRSSWAQPHSWEQCHQNCYLLTAQWTQVAQQRHQFYVLHPRVAYSAFTHWHQRACVHVLSAIWDHKQREGCGRWVVGYCCWAPFRTENICFKWVNSFYVDRTS